VKGDADLAVAALVLSILIVLIIFGGVVAR
jgi:hypothetical protein